MRSACHITLLIEDVSLKFCDLVQFMHHNYEVKKNAAEFVKILIDAILDDEALEKAAPNPLYGLGNLLWRHITVADCRFRRKRHLRLLPELMRRSSLIL